jgi:urate oxidase
VGIVLGPNQYGKAEVRVVAVDRATARHTIKDLNCPPPCAATSRPRT